MPETSIELRSFQQSDAARLAFLANNKKIWINLRDGFPYPYSLKDAGLFIDNCLKMKPQTVFAILFDEDLCGSIGLFKKEDVYRKSAEIGYWIGEPYWGRGIASLAVEKIVEFGFAELDINRIFTGIYDYNIASQKVLLKNGFTKEAVFEKAVYKNGKFVDEIRFSLIKALE
jgi:RimJ/RimL family protein N-acetyltransferase